MSEALHILRKDIRRLWREIAAVLSLDAVYTWMACRHIAETTTFTVLSLVAATFLVVRVILEEPLPGDRQFWITRPYAWKSLLGAKVLFVLAFLNLPLLITDCTILSWHGFPPAAQIAGLLWKQVIFTVMLAPPFAVGAISRNLAQVFGFYLTTVVAGVMPWVFLQHAQWNWGGDWIQETIDTLIVVTAAAVILGWQYRRRGTFRSRAVYAASIALGLLDAVILHAHPGYAIQSHLASPPSEYASVQLALDRTTGRQHHISEGAAWAGALPMLLPIQITGLPEDLDVYDVYQDGIQANIQAPDGQTWQSGWANAPDLHPQGAWLWAVVGYDLAQRTAPVRLRLAVALTLFRKERSVIVESSSQRFAVPDLGYCAVLRATSDSVPLFLDCVAAMRRPGRVLVYSADPARADFVYFASAPQYSPYPADTEFCPVFRLFSLATGQTVDRVGPKLKFVTERPVAHLLRELDIPQIRLSDYVVPQH